MNDVLARIPLQPVLDAPATSPLPHVPAAVPCTRTDPELWFAEAPCDVETAKALCAPCPVRSACLSGALARREPYGVWGGQLLIAGQVVARKRPRGRPRKSDVAA
jgi:WhiB family redox-sensing transcriptional regulator